MPKKLQSKIDGVGEFQLPQIVTYSNPLNILVSGRDGSVYNIREFDRNITS